MLDPIIIRVAGDGIREVQDGLRGIAGEADGLRDVGAAGGEAGDGLGAAASGADALRGRLEGIRNAGAVLAGLGAGGLALAGHFRDTAAEGNAVEARLEAVLKAQGRLNDLAKVNADIGDVTVRGHFDDDDSIRQATVLMANWEVQTKNMGPLLEAAGRQAQTTGQSVDDLANSFGKAIATGGHEGLKRTAVSFNATELAALDAAKAIGGATYEMTLTNAIVAAVGRTTGALGDSLTDTQKAANDAARGMDDAMTSVGTGVANAEAGVKRFGGSLLDLANGNPALLEAGGGLFYVGSMAATAAGSVIGLGSQVGLTMLAFPGLATSATAAFTLIKAGAITTYAALAPIAIPLVLAAVAAGALVVAFKGAEDAGTMAANRLIERWGALGKVWVWGGDKLERVQNFLSGEDTRSESTDTVAYNKYKASEEKHGRPVKSFGDWRGDPFGEEYAPLSASEKAATSTAGGGGADTDALMKTIQAAQAHPGSGAAGTAAISMAGGKTYTIENNVASVSGGLSNDEYGSQIEALQRELRGAKDKRRRQEISDQLFELNIAKKHAAADTKQDSAAQRQAAALRGGAIDGEAGIKVERERHRVGGEIERVQAQFDADTKAINDAVESGALSSGDGDANREALRKGLEEWREALQAGSDYAIKQIEGQAAVARAGSDKAAQALAQQKMKYDLAIASIGADNAGGSNMALLGNLNLGKRAVMRGLGGTPASAAEIAASTPAFNPNTWSRNDGSTPFVSNYADAARDAQSRGARVNAPQPTQRTLPSGKIEINFGRIEIENPWQREMERY